MSSRRRRSVPADVLPDLVPRPITPLSALQSASQALQEAALDSPQHAASAPATPSSVTHKRRTVSITSMPAWLSYNRFVHTGYRRHPSPAIDCLTSCFTYLHNETANIFTHLLPTFICLSWARADLARMASAESTAHLYGLIVLADISSAACFLFSALYHICMPATLSQAGYARLITVDVWGVWLCNVGAGLSLSLLLLPCAAPWGWAGVSARALIVLAPILGSFLWVAALAKDVKSRAAAFAVCWLTRVLSIVCTAALGASPWPLPLLAVHLLCEAAPAIGAYINVKRWPECDAPGRWDYLNSHTLMHVLVSVGMLGQHYLSHARVGLLMLSSPGQADVACGQAEWGHVLVQGIQHVQQAAAMLLRR